VSKAFGNLKAGDFMEMKGPFKKFEYKVCVRECALVGRGEGGLARDGERESAKEREREKDHE